MRAKGMPKESTIWEKTIAWVVLSATPRIMSEGSMVIARRIKIGMRQPRKPAMTT